MLLKRRHIGKERNRKEKDNRRDGKVGERKEKISRDKI